MNQNDHSWRRPWIWPLLALSLGALTGQILMVRIFSYTMNHGFVYMAVSLAMLGFGLSGVLMTLLPVLRRWNPGPMLQVCCAGFSLSLPGTLYVFSLQSTLADPQQGLSLFTPLAARLLLLSLPYVWAGLGIALALMAEGRGIGLRYGWNLGGSALGCAVAYPVLTRFGADGGLFVLSAVVCLMGAAAGRGAGRRGLLVLALLLGGALPWAGELLVFKPDAADQLADLVRHIEKEGLSADEVKLEYAAWDPVGRIEVHALPGEYGYMDRLAPLRFYSQDAGAGSVLLSLKEHPELRDALARGTLYGLASRLRPQGQALIIGIGGGPDLIATLATSAARVHAVEINQGTVRMLRHYAKFLDIQDDLEASRLLLHHADGRGYVRRHPDSFDVIQMTGADTYAANPAGASILSEGYLYTIEAFEDYFHALRPGGVLAVTRFGIESARVFNTAVAALKRVGVERPREHLAVVSQGSGDFWSTVLLSRDPFSASDIKRLQRLCAEGAPLARRCWIPVYNAVGFRFDSPLQLTLHPGMDVDLEAQGKKLAQDHYLLDPVVDDRPFFFQFEKPRPMTWDVLTGTAGFNRHHWGLVDYTRIAFQVSLVALLMVLVPLVSLFFSRVSVKEASSAGLGFLALGAGFMFLEVVLMQRCTLFLGHPNHAIVVVLFSLLVSSGLGSMLQGYLNLSRLWIFAGAILGIVVWIILFVLKGQDAFEAHLLDSLTSRVMTLVTWLFPLGLLLGMPFPAFLGVLEERQAALSPWAWGVNSFASVCASLIAIPLTMTGGFGDAFGLAGFCYLLALLGFVLFRRISARRLAL